MSELKAECGEFKRGSTRIQIKVFLNGIEVGVLTVARMYAAEVVRLINGV